MYTVISYSIRVVLVYLFTYFATRMMTKKAIAEMTAIEIAGLMVLANVASEPIVDKVVIKSIYGTGLLVFLMLITSRLAIKNKFTAFLEHTATIIIENGQINMEALKRLGISLNQFEGLLREKGYNKVSDVQTAIFEPQGNLSVFPKGENRPVTLKDLKLPSTNERITLPLIIDGSIVEENLKHIHKNQTWLLKELKKQGYENYNRTVALAELDSFWNLIIFKK